MKTQQAPSTFPIDGKQLPVPERVAPLFTPQQLGRLQLSNRIVYAPLTRCRAIGHIPQVRGSAQSASDSMTAHEVR